METKNERIEQAEMAPTGRGRRQSAILATLAVTLVALAVVALALSGSREPRPSDTAATFIMAYYASDEEGAVAMLSEDVAIVGSQDLADWRSDFAWRQAVGFTLADMRCPKGSATPTGTEVRCGIALHGLGSEQLGHGPFLGKFVVSVQDGKVNRVEEIFPYLSNGFSEQMWEPFEAWIRSEHPRDVEYLYEDGDRATELRLWRERIPEYVALQTN